MFNNGSGTAGDVAAWAFNVATSVAIVFSNKVLMDPKWGYRFIFGEPAVPEFRLFLLIHAVTFDSFHASKPRHCVLYISLRPPLWPRASRSSD